MEANDLSYSGPDRDYKPPVGSNSYDNSVVTTEPSRTYSDINQLKNDLSYIIEQLNLVISKANNELSNFSIDLNSSEKGKEAAKNIWINFETEKNNLISYKKIQELENRKDRASKFVVKEFMKEIRKPNGSSALDIKNISQIIYDEAVKINQLISLDFFGSQNTAEYRLIEIFMDFAKELKIHVARLDSFFELSPQERDYRIPESEIKSLNAKDANQYQALFTTNINGLNNEIDNETNYLNRFFSTSSDIFYQKVISPLMKLTNSGETMSTLSAYGSDLSIVGQDTVDAVNRNVVTALHDALDRSVKFLDRLNKVEERIALRENYLGFNRQLSNIGSKIISSLVENKKESKLEIKPINESYFINDHNTLSDREQIYSHEQYLSKYDDIITGDIIFLDRIKIDGVDLSAHRHDGKDGSQKLDGSSIVNQSIISDLIATKYGDKPSNLKLLSYYGSNVDIAAKLFWLSKNENTIYEIQTSLIPDLEFVDPGQEIEIIPEVPRSIGYIPPFESNDPLYIEWITEIDYSLFFN